MQKYSHQVPLSGLHRSCTYIRSWSIVQVYEYCREMSIVVCILTTNHIEILTEGLECFGSDFHISLYVARLDYNMQHQPILEMCLARVIQITTWLSADLVLYRASVIIISQLFHFFVNFNWHSYSIQRLHKVLSNTHVPIVSFCSIYLSIRQIHPTN